MIKAAIFDMDGVLIDTVELGFQARKKLLTRYGVDIDTLPDPQGENHRAASLKSLLANIKDYYGVHIDHDEFAKISLEYMDKNLRDNGITANPMLIAFLKELKQHNITCAITSSGLRQGVNIKLNILGIKQYFPIIVTSNEVSEHKPHPAPYLYTMKKLGLPPEDCIIFEDSLTGIQAGHTAGCKVIGFTQYNPPKGPLPTVVATVRRWGEINYEKLKYIATQSD